MAMQAPVCPYRQGEETSWCMLAEKGSPLRTDTIELKLRMLGDNWTSVEKAAFLAGVRWAEKCHGVTG
jgi:hypothetical protein